MELSVQNFFTNNGLSFAKDRFSRQLIGRPSMGTTSTSLGQTSLLRNLHTIIMSVETTLIQSPASILPERTWCDARIRYETDADAYDEDIAAAVVAESENDDDNHEEEEPVQVDETFHFSFGNNMDIQLQGCREDSNQIYKSTGMTVWRSAQHLCHYMTQHSDDLVQHKRVLELGSGLGLCGILAHRLGAAQVIMTDGDTDVLRQLRSNLPLNDIIIQQHEEQLSCHQLLWGQSSSQAFLQHYCANQPVDLILASDVIYTPVVIRPLWQTVQTLLHRKRGIFLMSYESKRQIRVSLQDVLSPARDMGLTCECLVERPEEGMFVWKFTWDNELL